MLFLPLVSYDGMSVTSSPGKKKGGMDEEAAPFGRA
jgi:hypothetical protein